MKFIKTSIPQSESITKSGDWWKLQAFETLYDGGIRQVDAAVEKIINSLRDNDVLDDTLLIITSDHGEGFGEWSRLNPSVRMVDHSWGIHEVLTHVPLLVRPPGGTKDEQVDRIASLTRFPEVVRSRINGGNQLFTVEEYALSMTNRLEDPTKVLPSKISEREEYGGPWFAVYESDDNGYVRKFAKQKSNEISVLIPDAQSSAVIDQGTNIVDDVYGELESAEIRSQKEPTQNPSEEVEQKLEDLGYLR